jgi:hypothetical protein
MSERSEKRRAQCNEATRRWQLKNPDRVRAARRAWRSKNLIRALVNEARSRSKSRGVEFTITVVDVPEPGPVCPLLGLAFSAVRGSACSPSLDRIDPSKGYIPGNVWIVGRRANMIKNDGSRQEHEQIAEAMKKAGL